MTIKNNWRILLGALLVILGIAAFLDSLNVIPFSGLLWGVLFALGGAAFIVYLLQNRKAWWAIIPGVVLIGLGFLILVSSIFPKFQDEIGGSIFFISISLAFLIVYLMNKKFWWAIIPAGVMASLAATIVVDGLTRFDGGGVLLLGIALTFAMLTVLPGLEGNRQWPLIPAGILFIVGLLAFFQDFNVSSLVWAVLLIAIGVFLVVRSLLHKSQP
ncbi:MAG: hypothetical protein IH585_10875 [Anaerolineaceae bacterium]|nr:hypothetical protein [Anaerolineaceae bacterium]